MKITLILIIALLSLAHAKQFSHGITMGINNANCDIKEDVGYIPKARNGFVGGLTTEYQITDIFFADMGLNYDKRGYYYSALDTTYLIKLDYFSLPLSIKYKKRINKFTPYISLGVLPAIQINASKMKKTEDSLGVATAIEKDQSGSEIFDIGFEGYIGLEYKAIDVKPFIQFGYYYGMLDLYESSSNIIKNRSLKLLLGVRL